MKKLLLLLFIFIPMHFLGQERLGTWKIEDVKVPPLQQTNLVMANSLGSII